MATEDTGIEEAPAGEQETDGDEEPTEIVGTYIATITVRRRKDEIGLVAFQVNELEAEIEGALSASGHIVRVKGNRTDK